MRPIPSPRLRLVAAWALTWTLAACGSGEGTRFGGAGARRTGEVAAKRRTSGANAAERPEGQAPLGEVPAALGPEVQPEAPVTPYESLTWLWQCDAQPGGTPQAVGDNPGGSPEAVVLKGGGTHELPRDRLDGTPVIFSGQLCAPETQERDIVFVIDTSLSMETNDPRVGGSCGRLKAVQAVIATLPKGSARIGLVTFHTGLGTTSPTLYDTPAALFAALAPGGDLAGVLCHEEGTTNYVAGLTQAATLLAQGRSKATKEIYLVSDGAPNLGEEGIGLAGTLKTTGVRLGTQDLPVTIGTVMLAGTDTVLEKFIASKNPATGKPLHVFVSQTDALAKALTDLSRNEVVSAELKYRVIGAPSYTQLDVLKHLKGLEFTLPPTRIPLDEGATGLEVVYEYRDRRGGRFTFGGTLKLSLGPAEDQAP